MNSTNDTRDNPERKPAPAGGAPALADDGDVAFGAMAGIAVISAVLVSMLALAGFFGGIPDSDTAPAAHSPEESTTSTTIERTTTIETDSDTEEPGAEEAEPAEAAVVAGPEGITLTGDVPNRDVADQLHQVAAGSYEEPSIDDQLQVVEGADPFILDVSGTLDSQQALDKLTAGFEGLALGANLSNGLALSENGSAVASLNDLVKLQPILFESGTATILAGSQPTVNEAAAILNASPDLRVEVSGHTDSRGNDAGNLDLSQRRADAVVAALQAQGVTNELVAIGFGETQLIENPDDTPEQQQTNRRIEFRVL